ncbi:mRNA surveillance protein pelota, partial [Candidatus Woesearchaeota archaeon]|nr:mRNA surveillance protein pelota [Candidatus Woesearchaeota archaeon]
MKIIHLNRKKSIAKIKVTNLDDLWHLSRIIEPNDLISGKIERKIKLGRAKEKSRAIRKSFFVKLKVDDIKYEAEALRLAGKIQEGPDELPKGASHTFDIKIGTIFKIEKKWKNYQVSRLKEAQAESQTPKAIACVLDDSEANIAAITPSGVKHLGKIALRLAKKRLKEPKQKEKLGKVVAELIRLEKEKDLDVIILGSPLFWKEELLKAIKDKSIKLAKKCRLEDVSTGSKRGITELINRGVIDKVLKKSRMQKEFQLVDNLLAEISKGGLGEYGLKQVKTAAKNSNIKVLLITDKFIST